MSNDALAIAIPSIAFAPRYSPRDAGDMQVCGLRNSHKSGGVEMKEETNVAESRIRALGRGNFDRQPRRKVPPLIVSHTHITSAKCHSYVPVQKSRRLWQTADPPLRVVPQACILGQAQVLKRAPAFRISYLAPVPGRVKRRVRRFVDGASLPSSDRWLPWPCSYPSRIALRRINAGA
jgi:hypothetical protein